MPLDLDPRAPADARLGWVEDIPDAVLVVAADGRVLRSNRHALDMLGGTAAGRDLRQVLRDPVPSTPAQSWTTVAWRASGAPIVLDVRRRRIVGPPAGMELLLLRERRVAVGPASATPLLEAAFSMAPIGMAFCDTDGRYVRVNAAMIELAGRSEEQLLGLRDQEITHPDDRQADLDAAGRILRGDLDTLQVEKRFVRPDGTVVWVIANLAFLRDDRRRPLAWLGQFVDITQRKQLEAHLRGLADEDPLTGLPNRRRLEGALHAALAGDRSGALLLVDLDGFKAVNDERGHAQGDAVLQRAARILRDAVRSDDLVVRLGGDEFAILLRGVDADRATACAEELRHRLADGPERERIAASIGVAPFGAPDERAVSALLQAADVAMYRDKDRRRRRSAA